MTTATPKPRPKTPARKTLKRPSPATATTTAAVTATATPQSNPQLNLSPGAKVEVKIDEEGFRGAWYGATVVQSSPSSRKRKRKASDSKAPTKYLVEYDALLAREGNSSKPLREFADLSSIRPAPPADDDEEKRLFKLHDVVDAFHRDGWWTGVVTRVGSGGSKFKVYFQSPPEEKEFVRSKLRLHRDWVDGEWVLWKAGTAIQVGKQQKVVITENKEQSQLETKTMSPESGVDIQDVSVPVIISGKKANASRNAAKEDGQLQFTPVVVGLLSEKAKDAHTSNPKKTESAKLLSGEKKHLNGAELLHNSMQDISVPESVVSTQKKKRGRPAKAMIKGHADTEKNGTETAITEVGIKDNMEMEAVPLLKTGSTSRGKKKQQKSMIKRHTDTEKNGAETASAEVLMKDNPEVEAVLLNRTGSTVKGRRKGKGGPRKHKGGPRKRSNKLSNIVSPLERIENQSNLTAAMESSSALKTYSSKRQGQKGMSDTEPSTPDTEDVFREKESGVSEAVVGETLSQNSEDLPLLMWFGGKKPRPTAQDSGIAVDKAIIKPCTNMNGRHEENATKSPAIASEDLLTGSEKDENLPFTKCFPVWTTLESMDIFQKMPQKPHFKPLLATKESNREGLAIAQMVTFANIAESASKFQIDDDLKNTIEGHLETLSDLEAHGFMVDPIRDRLNQFLLKKEEKGKLVGRLQEVRKELEERTLESTEIDQEVQELDKKIEELQAKLNSAKSAAGKIDTDIAAMESEFDVAIQEVQSARHDFEKLASAPWFS